MSSADTNIRALSNLVERALKLTQVLSVCLLRGPTFKNQMGFWIGDNAAIEEYIFGSRGDSGRIAEVVFKDNVCQHNLQLHLT